MPLSTGQPSESTQSQMSSLFFKVCLICASSAPQLKAGGGGGGMELKKGVRWSGERRCHLCACQIILSGLEILRWVRFSLVEGYVVGNWAQSISVGPLNLHCALQR